MQTTLDLDLAIRDSIAMEACKTWRDLEYVTRGIEARHAVEGVSKEALDLYEAEKARHARRVAPAMVA
jgi:hypothetical protein